MDGGVDISFFRGALKTRVFKLCVRGILKMCLQVRPLNPNRRILLEVVLDQSFRPVSQYDWTSQVLTKKLLNGT